MAKTHKTLQYQPPQTSNGENLFYHSSPKCSLANQTDLILCYFLSILTSPLPLNFAPDPAVEATNHSKISNRPNPNYHKQTHQQ